MTDAVLLNFKNSHASPTPVVEGDRVYVHFGAEGTAALTTSGDIVWTTRFPYISQHGNGGSPILYEDLLIINCDGYDESFVVAVDKNTGEVRWKAMRRQPFSQAYSTPLVIRVGDRDQIVSVGAFQAAAYDPESGKEIWRVAYPPRRFFQCPTSSLWPWACLHRHRIPAAVIIGRAGGRHGRREPDARRVDASAVRTADTVAAARGRGTLYRQ